MPEADPSDLVLVARHQPEEAISLLREFLERNPASENTYIALAKVYLGADRRREGLETIERLLPLLEKDDLLVDGGASGTKVIGQHPEAQGSFGELLVVSEAMTSIMPASRAASAEMLVASRTNDSATSGSRLVMRSVRNSRRNSSCSSRLSAMSVT